MESNRGSRDDVVATGDGPEPPGAHRWIVGVDGSDDSVDALRWALRRANAVSGSTAPIVIGAISAWSVPMTTPVGLPAVTVPDLSGFEAAVRDRLDAAVAAVVTADEPRAGIQVETDVVQGSAARVLFDAACDSELLVVGRRGRSTFAELVLGSVSRQSATHAPVPTVVVPRDVPASDLRHVAVGFDGSDHAIAALRWVLDDAAWIPPEVDIEVIGAFDVSPYVDPDITRARFGSEIDTAEADFDHMVDALDPNRRCRRTFSLHGARRSLGAASEHADLVVLGARGHGTLAAALLGSVSNWMLHHASCPIVVVPRR